MTLFISIAIFVLAIISHRLIHAVFLLMIAAIILAIGFGFIYVLVDVLVVGG
jgi:hypothetical protein